jgi:hypothetical protein
MLGGDTWAEGADRRADRRLRAGASAARQAVDEATHAAILRADGEWVAVVWRAGRPLVLERSLLASPLVASLRERGYTLRFVFAWNHPEHYLAEPAPGE